MFNSLEEFREFTKGFPDNLQIKLEENDGTRRVVSGISLVTKNHNQEQTLVLTLLDAKEGDEKEAPRL